MKQCNNVTNILKIILILYVSSCTSEITESSVDDNKVSLSPESVNASNVVKHNNSVVWAVNVPGPEYLGFDGISYQADNFSLAGRSGQIKTLDTEFQNYSIELTPRDVSVFSNGVPYFFYQNGLNAWRALPLDQTYQLILNLAISGQQGRLGGSIDDRIFPVRTEIGYV